MKTLLQEMKELAHGVVLNFGTDINQDYEMILKGERSTYYILHRVCGTACISDEDIGNRLSDSFVYFFYNWERIRHYYKIDNVTRVDGKVYGEIKEISRDKIMKLKKDARTPIALNVRYNDGYTEQITPDQSCYAHYDHMISQHGITTEYEWLYA